MHQKAEDRSVVGSWFAMFALAVLLMLGGLYLLQRKRSNLTISKNLYFRAYEGYKLDLGNKSKEVFVLSKILARGEDGILPDLNNDGEMKKILFGYRNMSESVNLSFCFKFSQKGNSEKQESPGAEYEDVFQCSKLVPSTNNIFFLETSCAGSKLKTPTGLNLSAKQACSIYSAAYHNPHRKVILLFTCPLGTGFYTLTKKWVKVLWDVPNFYFGQIDLVDFYANTSLLEFYHEVQTYSEYHIVHQSDILRLFVLYLYGGTYMDLDVISLRPLDDLGVNFLGFERSDSVNNAVMNFEPKHKFLELGFSKALLGYEPNQWATIGPNMITKIIRKCNVSGNFDHSSSLHVRSCNLSILPLKIFYAVGGGDWSYFYNETLWPKFKEILNESYVTHYWNHLGSFPLITGSNQPLIKLAEQHCTGVYNVSGLVMQTNLAQNEPITPLP